MRLVCPNCEAKYEVPEDAIPDTGRDVQCANCGHAWFQMRPRAASAAAEALAATVAPQTPAAAETAPEPEPETDVQAPPADQPAPVPDEAAPPAEASETATDASAAGRVEEDAPAPLEDAPAVEEAVVETAAEEGPASQDTPSGAEETGTDVADPTPTATEAVGASDDEAEEPEAPKSAPAAAAAAYAVDETVLAILREEAEREAQARAAEARAAEGRGLETQPDLGVEAAIPDRKPPADVVAVPPAADAEIEGELKPSARRDLLPDVEEINSTLRPSEVPEDMTAQAVAPSRGGGSAFRGGFLTVMVLSILGAAVYITAPTLSRLVPASAEPLTAYVGAVDGLRLALDGLMRSATVAINGQ